MASNNETKGSTRHKCSFADCTNTKARFPHLHFFKFPVSRPHVCDQWILNCANETLDSLQDKTLRRRVVCEEHFTDSSFTNSFKKRLNPNAVPTHLAQQSNIFKTPKHSNSVIKCDIVTPPQQIIVTQSKKDEGPQHSASPIKISNIIRRSLFETSREKVLDIPSYKKYKSVKNRKSKQKQIVMPNRKRLLKRLIKALQDKKKLRQAILRTQNKAQTISKELLMESLKLYLPEKVALFVNMQIKHFDKKETPWNEEEKKQALAMRTQTEIKMQMDPCKNEGLQENTQDRCSKSITHNFDYESSHMIVEKSIELESDSLNGRRLVDIRYLIKQLEYVANHPKQCAGKYKFKREICTGLCSTWVYFCKICEKRFCVTSEPLPKKQRANDALAKGASRIGIGYSKMKTLFSFLNVPFMDEKKFKYHITKNAEVGVPPKKSNSLKSKIGNTVIRAKKVEDTPPLNFSPHSKKKIPLYKQYSRRCKTNISISPVTHKLTSCNKSSSSNIKLVEELVTGSELLSVPKLQQDIELRTSEESARNYNLDKSEDNFNTFKKLVSSESSTPRPVSLTDTRSSISSELCSGDIEKSRESSPPSSKSPSALDKNYDVTKTFNLPKTLNKNNNYGKSNLEENKCLSTSNKGTMTSILPLFSDFECSITSMVNVHEHSDKEAQNCENIKLDSSSIHVSTSSATSVISVSSSEESESEDLPTDVSSHSSSDRHFRSAEKRFFNTIPLRTYEKKRVESPYTRNSLSSTLSESNSVTSQLVTEKSAPSSDSLTPISDQQKSTSSSSCHVQTISTDMWPIRGPESNLIYFEMTVSKKDVESLKSKTENTVIRAKKVENKLPSNFSPHSKNDNSVEKVHSRKSKRNISISPLTQEHILCNKCSSSNIKWIEEPVTGSTLLSIPKLHQDIELRTSEKSTPNYNLIKSKDSFNTTKKIVSNASSTPRPISFTDTRSSFSSKLCSCDTEKSSESLPPSLKRPSASGKNFGVNENFILYKILNENSSCEKTNVEENKCSSGTSSQMFRLSTQQSEEEIMPSTSSLFSDYESENIMLDSASIHDCTSHTNAAISFYTSEESESKGLPIDGQVSTHSSLDRHILGAEKTYDSKDESLTAEHDYTNVKNPLRTYKKKRIDTTCKSNSLSSTLSEISWVTPQIGTEYASPSSDSLTSLSDQQASTSCGSSHVQTISTDMCAPSLNPSLGRAVPKLCCLSKPDILKRPKARSKKKKSRMNGGLVRWKRLLQTSKSKCNILDDKKNHSSRSQYILPEVQNHHVSKLKTSINEDTDALNHETFSPMETSPKNYSVDSEMEVKEEYPFLREVKEENTLGTDFCEDENTDLEGDETNLPTNFASVEVEIKEENPFRIYFCENENTDLEREDETNLPINLASEEMEIKEENPFGTDFHENGNTDLGMEIKEENPFGSDLSEHENSDAEFNEEQSNEANIEDVYICETCSESFPNQAKLSIHVSSEHPSLMELVFFK